ncbi:MAG: hypothetical protein ACHQX1_02290 [Candidatus Micrarchaeales archaeon]
MVRKKGILHKFYFIKPRENADADDLAERLISLKLVEEVFLTDGDYGFVVKARFLNGKEPDNVTRYISRNLSAKFGKVVSHYEFKK